jgi:hypothetical protein
VPGFGAEAFPSTEKRKWQKSAFLAGNLDQGRADQPEKPEKLAEMARKRRQFEKPKLCR